MSALLKAELAAERDPFVKEGPAGNA